MDKLRDSIDNLLFKYWTGLPEPKMTYTEWWYGRGGIKEMLDGRHLIQSNEREKIYNELIESNSKRALLAESVVVD